MEQISERRHWDGFWGDSRSLDDVYDNDNRIVAFLASRFDLAGMRILEVGAGTGRDSAALADLGAEVWTLDYSEESLKILSGELEEKVEVVCGDALALPVADGTFDLVFHQGLLEHFRNPEVLIAENHRVLKKDGHVLVDVPQRFHYYTLGKHILMFFDKWFAGWETEYSVAELKKIVTDGGFDVEGLYGHNLYPPIWYRAGRKVLLRTGLRLPMRPLDGGFFRGLRSVLRRLLPAPVRLSTSMVIGCLGRKT